MCVISSHVVPLYLTSGPGFTGAEPFLSYLLVPSTDVTHSKCSVDTEIELWMQMKLLEMRLEIPGAQQINLQKFLEGEAWAKLSSLHGMLDNTQEIINYMFALWNFEEYCVHQNEWTFCNHLEK